MPSGTAHGQCISWCFMPSSQQGIDQTRPGIGSLFTAARPICLSLTAIVLITFQYYSITTWPTSRHYKNQHPARRTRRNNIPHDSFLCILRNLEQYDNKLINRLMDQCTLWYKKKSCIVGFKFIVGYNVLFKTSTIMIFFFYIKWHTQHIFISD